MFTFLLALFLISTHSWEIHLSLTQLNAPLHQPVAKWLLFGAGQVVYGGFITITTAACCGCTPKNSELCRAETANSRVNRRSKRSLSHYVQSFGPLLIQKYRLKQLPDFLHWCHHISTFLCVCVILLLSLFTTDVIYYWKKTVFCDHFFCQCPWSVGHSITRAQRPYLLPPCIIGC